MGSPILYRGAVKALHDRGIDASRSWMGSYATTLDQAGFSFAISALDPEARSCMTHRPTLRASSGSDPGREWAGRRHGDPDHPCHLPATRDAADELSRLDAVAGDGDHGVNMAAAFADADARIAAARPQSAAEVFLLVGRVFNESGSGSAGVLFGALFATIGGRLDAAVAPEISDLVDGLELASRRVGDRPLEAG